MADTEEEPVWAQVLQILYEKGMQGEEFDEYGKTALSRQLTIAEELDRESGEVTRAVQSLQKNNLIEAVPIHSRKGYSLTEKGFDVAHTRSLRRHEQEIQDRRNQRQHDVNRAVGYLTLGLVFMGFIQTTVSALVGKNAPLWQVNGVLVIGFFVAVGLGILLSQSGLLSDWTER